MSTATRPRWTPGPVTVAIGSVGRRGRLRRTGSQMIDAEIWGPFAVHRPLKPWHGGWDVTHAPSGLSMVTCLPTKRAAKAYCVEIADLLDWATVTPETSRALIEPVEAQIRAASRRARGWDVPPVPEAARAGGTP